MQKNEMIVFNALCSDTITIILLERMSEEEQPVLKMVVQNLG